jgi:hypothetical protein
MSAIILEAGNTLTLTGTAPSDGVNVANGTLIYGANQTDTSVAYLRGAGGDVQIAASVKLTSKQCTLNGANIEDDTIGSGKYVQTIGAGGDWEVDPINYGTEVGDAGDTAMPEYLMTMLMMRRN